MSNEKPNASWPAAFSALQDMHVWSSGFAHQYGMAPQQIQRLQILIEELLTNTIEHGQISTGESTVTLSIQRDNDQIVLIYSDAGIPFDPLSTHVCDDSVSRQRGGGVGIDLVRAFCVGAQYHREPERNVLTLRLALE